MQEKLEKVFVVILWMYYVERKKTKLQITFPIFCTYVLGSSSIWKCRILNNEYLLLFSDAVDKIKANSENSTRPNQ
jgi:hypothetical protein